MLGRPDGGLRCGRGPAAQVDPMPVCLADRLADALARVGHTRQLGERSERIVHRSHG